MKKLIQTTFGEIQRNWKVLVLIAAVALFVLAAGAPSATIGIGK